MTSRNSWLTKLSWWTATGTYDINAVAELRHNRLVDSIKNNPQLEFTSPLILSAYSKAIFPIIFFIDGHLNSRRLTTDGARRFFELQYMPADFHRQPSPINFTVIELLVGQNFYKYPFVPGVNHGKNNYKELPNTPALSDICGICEEEPRLLFYPRCY